MAHFEYYRPTSAKEATDALKALGGAESTVHRRLRDMRLKGRARRSASCIIAKYLQEKFPKAIISVGYEWSYVDGHLIRMPKPLTAIIEHFDAGKYPDLLITKKKC